MRSISLIELIVEASKPRQEMPLEEMNQSSASDEPISWWDSTNAFSLFGERAYEDNGDKDANDDEDAWNVKAMVRKRIEILRKGQSL